MMRRMFWFVSGAVAGASIVVWLKRAIASVSEKLTPAHMADAIASTVRRGVMALSDGAMSLVDAYRNRESTGSVPTPSSASISSPTSTRRHNPPRQRTSHR